MRLPIDTEQMTFLAVAGPEAVLDSAGAAPRVGHADPVLAAVDARLAGALPHARRHTLVDAGHVPHLTRPDEFVRVGLAFLDDVTSSIAGGQPKEH
ncbi:MAG: hypothetical protein M3O70_00335 [Actinomycetota bacterium]|nr:hypothetical protein [Actinomycetota bacterium]